jgi:hypothetical protein
METNSEPGRGWVDACAEEIVDNIGLGKMMLAKFRPGYVAWVRACIQQHLELAFQFGAIEPSPPRGKCGMRYHHKDCDCGGEGGDR